VSTLADRTISALRGNHDELTARVSELDEGDLARQSGSSLWDVAQVLGHLGSGAEIALAGLQAGIAGHEAPGQDFTQLVWDRWNAMSAQEKAQGFLGANEQVVTAYESLDATARQEVQVKLAFLHFPADVSLLSGLRLNEAALHGWDVRVAFDLQATLTVLETAAMLEQLTGLLTFCSDSWPNRRSSKVSRPPCRWKLPTLTGSLAWSLAKASASARRRPMSAVF
jgi:uncharacterized protein (TIGR03083 family)